ncbi:MAG: cupin domain-containing protein [Actinobacteria bacterium]|nr:cupin domain-containing protein [Actinomycetota bacterium]MCB8995861.1 cupin domain-containing protein [Actinomycetota bacterium]MCB9424578.1 cupin domain-containing protein [Actinomycetota bacterium]HRY08468.1 cupin domain-containing protein [Candidatus Nanopelagicales bacterium]
MTAPEARRLDDVTGWNGSAEFVEVLHRGAGTAIERIVSQGHTTDWCDQDHDEWVLVHEGAARLELVEGRTLDLVAGQYVLLPARCRHRVVWTEQLTVWVTVHFPAVGGG